MRRASVAESSQPSGSCGAMTSELIHIGARALQVAGRDAGAGAVEMDLAGRERRGQRLFQRMVEIGQRARRVAAGQCGIAGLRPEARLRRHVGIGQHRTALERSGGFGKLAGLAQRIALAVRGIGAAALARPFGGIGKAGLGLRSALDRQADRRSAMAGGITDARAAALLLLRDSRPRFRRALLVAMAHQRLELGRVRTLRSGGGKRDEEQHHQGSVRDATVAISRAMSCGRERR